MPVIQTFADLMGSHQSAQISCMYTKDVVRKLTVNGEDVTLDACNGTVVTIPLITQVSYRPWLLDRGSILFPASAVKEQDRIPPHDALKLCGEGDRIQYDNGEIDTIQPHSSIIAAGLAKKR